MAGKPNSFWTYLISSTFSGICVCAVMQPADTALSRVYNQPTAIDGESNVRGAVFNRILTNALSCSTARGKSVGTLYRGPLHCLYLTAKTEGPLAWYKGTTAHLVRIAPHTVSCRFLLSSSRLTLFCWWIPLTRSSLLSWTKHICGIIPTGSLEERSLLLQQKHHRSIPFVKVIKKYNTSNC